MKTRTKSILLYVGLFVIYLAVALYGFSTQVPAKPPEATEYAIVVDLRDADHGTIHFIVPEDEIVDPSPDNLYSRFGAVGHDILEDQYMLIHSPANSIEQEGPNTHIQIEFVAEDKYVFSWPVRTFTTRFLSFYQIVDFTVVLPEGCEITDVTITNEAEEPVQATENNRRKLLTKTKENETFQLELTYERTE